MEKLPEHCPGPPVGQLDNTVKAAMDIDLGKQLRSKEEELQQLRNEVESYTGKLRTFQTLGNYFNACCELMCQMLVCSSMPNFILYTMAQITEMYPLPTQYNPDAGSNDIDIDFQYMSH